MTGVSPNLSFDWTVNVGQIATLVWVTILILFFTARIWFIFREYPPHKHIDGKGKFSRLTGGTREQIIYPRGMGPRE